MPARYQSTETRQEHRKTPMTRIAPCVSEARAVRAGRDRANADRRTTSPSFIASSLVRINCFRAYFGAREEQALDAARRTRDAVREADAADRVDLHAHAQLADRGVAHGAKAHRKAAFRAPRCCVSREYHVHIRDASIQDQRAQAEHGRVADGLVARARLTSESMRWVRVAAFRLRYHDRSRARRVHRRV